MSQTKSIVAVAKSLEQAEARANRRVTAAEARVEKARQALMEAERLLAEAEQERSRVEATITAVLVAAEGFKPAGEERVGRVPARERVAAQVLAPTAKRVTVTTDTGDVRPLSAGVADELRAVIGRRKSGLLEPLDGEDAQAVLTALDEGGNVGDVFTVALGRRTVRFTVEVEGLRFGSV